MIDQTYASYCAAALYGQGITSVAIHNDLYIGVANYDRAVAILTERLGWEVNDTGSLVRHDPVFPGEIVTVTVHCVDELPTLPERRIIDEPLSFNV